MPGEVPFVVVSPDDDDLAERVRPEAPAIEPVDGGPWYRRLGRAVAGLFEGA
jgi:hypothetical protein